MIKASDYMRAAFPQEMLVKGESPLLSHPASFVKDGQVMDYHKQYYANNRGLLRADEEAEGWLTCVSTVRRQGKPTRKYDDVQRAFILPFDDIGTKAKPNDIEPSCILETSPGNYQWHYFIDPFDVTTARGQDYYDAAMMCAAAAGLSDSGMRSATRVCKLPGAIHKTGFVTRVDAWNPDIAWDLRELMDALGVTVKPVRRARGAPKPGKYDRLEDVDDALYAWLVDAWAVYGHGGDWVYIECPWRHTHTDNQQGTSSTAYSPQDYGRAGRQFKCMHGHCQAHGTAEFLNFMRAKGARI